MKAALLLGCTLIFVGHALAQGPQAAKIELGSQTAKNGFRNEDEIRDKFNNWQADADVRVWLAAMNYKVAEIQSVTAAKPNGEKADIEVKIKTKRGVSTEGISIKLVSSANGFNQIDKRWLSQYAKMWRMPRDVVDSLRLFVGEARPNKPSRNTGRMFLNELDAAAQKSVVDFFAANKAEIVSDLFRGDGLHTAQWIMVALKSRGNARWVLRDINYAIGFFGEGPVSITRNGNLKIGRITMQRKGGDAGRHTARMLQFKINPVLLFDSK